MIWNRPKTAQEVKFKYVLYLQAFWHFIFLGSVAKSTFFNSKSLFFLIQWTNKTIKTDFLHFGFLFEKADGTRRVPATQARKINNQMGWSFLLVQNSNVFCWFKMGRERGKKITLLRHNRKNAILKLEMINCWILFSKIINYSFDLMGFDLCPITDDLFWKMCIKLYSSQLIFIVFFVKLIITIRFVKKILPQSANQCLKDKKMNEEYYNNFL